MSNDNRTYTFYLPSYIDLPISPKARSKNNKKRLAEGKPFNRKYLNLNVYRNLDPFANDQMKKLFKPLSGELFKAEKIRISYYVEKKMKRLFDTRNISDVVDKFFCDWLVENECIPDDNFMHVCHGGDDGIYGCITDRVIATVEVLM